MEQEKSNLKVYTSFVSPFTLKEFINKNLLPIFIIRNIKTSELIGKYSDTPIHFAELSPSTELFRRKRDNLITLEEYQKLYANEIVKIDLNDIVKRLEMLANISGASGVVILGYGSSLENCHRKILSEILNNSGLFNNRIKEILL